MNSKEPAKNGNQTNEKLSKGPLWQRAFDDLSNGRLFSYLAMIDSSNIGEGVIAHTEFAMKHFQQDRVNNDKKMIDMEKFQNWKPNESITNMYSTAAHVPESLTDMDVDTHCRSPIITTTRNVLKRSNRKKNDRLPETNDRACKTSETRVKPFAPTFTTAKKELERQSDRKGNKTSSTDSDNTLKKPRFLPPGKSGNVPPSEDDEGEMKGVDKKLIELIESEIIDSKSKITWDDIAGLDQIKDAIHYAVINPMKRPELFKGIRAAPKGVLLFGPPGTGKTLVGKCIAASVEATFFSISASSLTSKWIGEGEKLVRVLFALARQRSPSVVFVDEIDSLLSARSDGEHESSRRIKTEFLVQLDGCRTDEDDDKFVLLIGATNRPECLDEAARRRLTKRLYVPLPCPDARKQILEKLISDQRHTITNDHMVTLVEKTEGYSGADINSLCREAALAPLRNIGCLDNIDNIDLLPPIEYSHFVAALKSVKPSVAESEVNRYIDFQNKFGC